VAYNPAAGTMPAYDVYLNDVKQTGDWDNVAFRGVTSYAPVTAGHVKIGIKAVGASASAPYVAERHFMTTSNAFYTVGFAGPLAAPDGMVVNGTNPVVNLDLRKVPNPGRSHGLWYRWSETPATIDFRAIANDPFDAATCNADCIDVPALGGSGNGCPSCPITAAADKERISELLAKTVIQLSELAEGRYSFYPVLEDRNDPLYNGVKNAIVGVRNLQVNGAVATATGTRGTWYDFFAQGDSLLNPHVNNLEVKSTTTNVEYDSATACHFVLDSQNNRVGEAVIAGTTSGASAVATSAAALAAAAFTIFAAAY
jgi:hypothetical protein